MKFEIIILMVLLQETFVISNYTKACNDTLFCYGDILEKIQMSEIFKDSKTFVDMPLKTNAPDRKQLQEEILNITTKDALKDFVDRYFLQPGEKELLKFKVDDYTNTPALLQKIKDENYRDWAQSLCKIWTKLVRKMDKDVEMNPDKHTLIYLNESFVIPGGRFREVYYWDTFWVIDGLCLCDMFETAKSILKNFLQLVQQYGFIPNGGRKYYLNRSQPPLLSLMMEKYLHYTKDYEFIKENIGLLVKEYEFWTRERHISIKLVGRTYDLVRYNSMMGYPRPESYKEDVHTMWHIGNETAQKELYSHIASAAESGWDFSSRWFTNVNDGLKSIQTRQIVPLDLNCIIYKVETILSDFYSNIMNDTTTGMNYKNKASKRFSDINDFFWNEDFGSWLDYDMSKQDHNKEFYASSFFPFWLLSNSDNKQMKIRFKKAYEKFKSLNVFSYDGGIPTSFIDSGEQWDFPNGWPPLQYVAVHGLLNVGDEDMRKSAKFAAKNYIETAYLTWKETGHMFEKYDVTKRGKGHGGEYDVQEGFGWTNGVALNFLSIYSNELSSTVNSGSVKNYISFSFTILQSITVLFFHTMM